MSVSGYSVLFVIVRQLIPEDLAEVAPGPELARVLAGIELSRLSGYDCVEVLKARYRQLNHERAQLMAAMVEVGLCGIGPDDELPRDRLWPDGTGTGQRSVGLAFHEAALLEAGFDEVGVVWQDLEERVLVALR